ncbi:MAG: protoglobin domain-containing protein [Flavobacteriaceae bacterium]|nr:protoglobin domain-containing protein [Flavobacteriaceae bacterium]
MLDEITKKILLELPEQTKVTEKDIQTLRTNKDFLLGLVDSIVTDFYDTLYANEATKAVFHEGERPAREKSFKAWFVKTIEGEFDLKYWSWQTFVGILHVKRKVKNNMMIAMMGRITDILTTEAIKELPTDVVIELKTAWSKLTATVLALIGESYHIFYMKAVSNVTGMNQSLLENTVKVEIDNLIDQNMHHRM